MTKVGYWKLLLHYAQYYVYKQFDTKKNFKKTYVLEN